MQAVGADAPEVWMLTVAQLRRRPRSFQNFTGLTPAQFDTLLTALEPVYAAQERARKARPHRQRAIGGGRQFQLALAERCLLTLIYLRLYVTQPLVGYLVGLDNSNVSREINHRMRPALGAILPVPPREELGVIVRAAPPPGRAPERKRIGTLAELLRAHPELRTLLIDATEQPVPKPTAKGPRRERYSGKQKRHTLKTQLVTAALAPGRPGLVLHASRSVPGSVHDRTVLRASGVLYQLPPGVGARLDRGYLGVAAEYPAVPITTPISARARHPLTALERAWNRLQATLRVGIEHVLAGLKHFQILAGLYRGRLLRYDDDFGVVAGLYNFRVLGRLTW